MKPGIHAIPCTVEVHEFSSTRTDYTGQQKDLVAAGIATDDMFPVWPKRNLDHRFDPPANRRQECLIKYAKGGRYIVIWWHEPIKKPAPWDPAAFKRELSNNVELCRRLLRSYATGAYEAQSGGRKTHRLREADLDRLLALLDDMDGVIDRAAVERCYRDSHLRLIE